MFLVIFMFETMQFRLQKSNQRRGVFNLKTENIKYSDKHLDWFIRQAWQWINFRTSEKNLCTKYTNHINLFCPKLGNFSLALISSFKQLFFVTFRQGLVSIYRIFLGSIKISIDIFSDLRISGIRDKLSLSQLFYFY
jgi:hypothetical protein